MQQEIYNATNTSFPVPISATAKAALPGPQTKENLLGARADMIALQAAGKVKFIDNAHLLLATVNPQTIIIQGRQQENAFYNLDTLQLSAIKTG